jgi:hypothetical protein
MNTLLLVDVKLLILILVAFRVVMFLHRLA